MYERPMVEVKLPPIAVLDHVEYSEAEKQEMIKKAQVLIDMKIDKYEKLIEAVHHYGKVEFESAEPKDISGNETPSCLFSSMVPEWVSTEELFRLFNPFTTYEGDMNYPRITRHGVTVTIQYAAGTQDGYYALMLRGAKEFKNGRQTAFVRFGFKKHT